MTPWFVAPVIIEVCPQPGPDCDVTTIEDALLMEPDFVELHPGRYPTHNVRVDVEGVTIKSRDANQPATLTVAASALDQPGPMLVIEADDVAISNLVFDGTSVQAPVNTRAMVVRDADDVTVFDVDAYGFQWAPSGGVLLVEDGSVIVGDSTLRDSQAQVFGGLVFARSVTDPTDVVILDSTLRGGTADYGGAIATENASVYLDGATLADNNGRIKAGHLLVQNGALDVRESSLRGGSAPQWGLVDVQTSPSVTLIDTVLGGTNPSSSGLVLVQNADNTSLSDITMDAIGASAPGLHVQGGGATLVENSTFANSAVETVGAVFVDGPFTATVRQSWFCNAGSTRGALEIVNDCAGGCFVEDSFFLGNESQIVVPPPPDPPSAAAVVSVVQGGMFLNRNTLANNVHQSGALTGSVIALVGDDVSMTDSLLHANASTGLQTELSATTSTFVSRNSSTEPEGLVPGDGAPNLLPALPPRTFGDGLLFTQPQACRSFGPWVPDPNDPGPFPGALGSDNDGDGFILANDCADFDGGVNPGQREIVGDGIDQDCDDLEACYPDEDGDGFGANVVELSTDFGCLLSGNATVSGDCDDSDAFIYPGAPEELDDIDSDCDGFPNPDNDDDGFRQPEDCDDTDPTIYPGAPDPFDGIDQNCDDAPEIDRDGDGVPPPEDCDDGDPDRIRCRGYLAGVGCAVDAPAPFWLALVLLAAVRTRRGAVS